jgi:hypothetical protein
MKKTRFYVGEKGQDPVKDFNSAQAGGSHEEKAVQLEYWLAKNIGEDLCRVYKNRQWGVDVDTRNKIVVITAPSLSKVYGHHLYIRDGETVPQLIERCRRAAGEILERYGVTRARNTDPLIIEEELPRDIKDNVISADAIPAARVKHV